MRKIPLIIAITLVPAAGAALQTDEEIITLVEKAEKGYGLDEAIELLENSAGVPRLTEAALGRLWVIKSGRTAFLLTAIIREQRGLGILGDYVVVHPDDPYALLWRGRSAIETNYLLADPATAKADLERAVEILGTDRPDPARRAVCYLELGYLALDFGDVARARTYWELAIITAPDIPAAEEAGEMLELTKG